MANELVPFRQTLYTDKLELPKRVEQTYKVVKTSEVLASITQSSSVGVGFNFTFTLANNVPDYTYYTYVFDQYRITHAELIITPQAQQALISATQPQGTFATCLDYDNNSNPISMGQVLGFSTAVSCPVTSPMRRCLHPRVALAAYNGSFLGYVNSSAPWIDCSSTNVVHYGIKGFVDTGAAGSLAVFNVLARVVVEFRSAI